MDQLGAAVALLAGSSIITLSPAQKRTVMEQVVRLRESFEAGYLHVLSQFDSSPGVVPGARRRVGHAFLTQRMRYAGGDATRDVDAARRLDPDGTGYDLALLDPDNRPDPCLGMPEDPAAPATDHNNDGDDKNNNNDGGGADDGGADDGAERAEGEGHPVGGGVSDPDGVAGAAEAILGDGASGPGDGASATGGGGASATGGCRGASASGGGGAAGAGAAFGSGATTGTGAADAAGTGGGAAGGAAGGAGGGSAVEVGLPRLGAALAAGLITRGHVEVAAGRWPGSRHTWPTGATGTGSAAAPRSMRS